MIEKLKYTIFTMVIAVSSCSWADSTNKEGNEVININKKKTWCIGRYSVELPSEANFYEQLDNYDSFKIETLSRKASRSDFDQIVEKTLKIYTIDDAEILKNFPVIQESNGSISKIILGNLDSSISKVVHVRAFVLDKGYLFSIEGQYSPKFENESKEAIQNLVKNLKMRQDNIIPKEKGFCIKNGFIHDSGQKYRYTSQRLMMCAAKTEDFDLGDSMQLTYKSPLPFDSVS
ncbi:hypothetical protein [Acinetobacter sp. WCHAc060025]|uniref:hypothetical protein n=1 Tax=Acinetobacter sp. WCHAc060025 TaxID=2518625 RepID=UPI001023A2C9|nr:hypothetical protein [Acinetobacter sp. WCHAc060025]RZG76430.1 hypothetical protein EXE09_07345 [Acinetobacter sp. WCHAc060025]